MRMRPPIVRAHLSWSPLMSLRNLSVRARLAGLIVFVNVLLVATAGYSWFAIVTMNNRMDAGFAEEARISLVSDQSRQVQVHFKIQVQEWKDLLLRGSEPEAHEKHARNFAERRDLVDRELAKLATMAAELGMSRKPFDDLLTEHADLHSRYAEAFKSNERGDAANGFVVDRKVRGMDRTMTERLDALVNDVNKVSELRSKEVERAADEERFRLLNGLIVLVAFTVVVSVSAGWLVIRVIGRRLEQATTIARTVAKGDLSTKIAAESGDELGKLIESLGDMNDSLATIVSGVRSSAETVSPASTQIAAGNTELSSRTEEQASSLEETAASLEEMTATVDQNARNAAQANELAAGAASIAKRGGSAVDQVVSTMD